MVIYAANGTAIIYVKVDDTSYLYEEIMGDASVQLEFSLTEHIEIEPGSYILFRGVKYVLMSREGVTIQHTRDYEYKATFCGPQARFGKYVVYNFIDGRLRFDMIGKPLDHLTLVLQNLNTREPGVWSLGDCVTDKAEMLISYSHTNIKDALTAIAEAFDTEWSVTPAGNGYAINLKKVELNKDNPLALGYGKNQGFKPGVGRMNYGEFGQVEKVWIDGGERNLSIGEYGYTTLHFPKSLAFLSDAAGKLKYTVDGTTYTEDGFDAASALAFVTDEWGASVRLQGAASSCNEASLDLTQFYPKRVGHVTGVYYLYKGQYLTYDELVEAFPALTDEDWLEIQVDIVDNTIPAALDFSKCLLGNDEPLTVIFQNGMLVGREFNATFVKAAKTRVVDGQTQTLRPANRFELVRTTIDGVDMPNATFRPNTGSLQAEDEYIVVNIYMPDEYICDFAGFEGAEIDALREAVKFIRENKDPQFTFKGTVDDLYSKRNWLTVGGKLVLGGCISFQNESIQPEPIVTRIIGLKTYLNSPYAPELTLSNETVKGGMSSSIAKLRADDEHTIERVKEGRRFTQRSFRDAKETIGMLAGALDYFTEGIRPITVETMSLLVGDASLQFRFWTDRSCTTPVLNPVTYDPDTHTVVIPACAVQHMTLGIDDVRPATSRSANEYLRWMMAQYESPALTGTDEQGNDVAGTAFYLYAKVDAANVPNPQTEAELAHAVGTFVLSKTKLPFKPTEGDNYYHLLVGILNSEYEGGRSFAPMYGFTEVLPGQITTDVIRSSSGTSYFDLVNNQFALGDSLSFINNVLALRGALVVNGAGERTEIGAWCGQWNVPAGRQYAKGDEVWWQAADGTISTYRYTNDTPSYAAASNDPSHGNYWTPIAKGVAGTNGNPGPFKSTVFMRTNDNMETAQNTPTGGSYTTPRPESTHTDSASGDVLTWSDGIPAGEETLWASSRTFNYDNTGEGWSMPRRMTDTDTYDVEFAYKQVSDADPAVPVDGENGNRHGCSPASNQVWFDPELDKYTTGTTPRSFKDMYWRAEREKKNGVWGDWTIVRIKGEKGDASPGLSVDMSNEVDGLAVGSDEVLDVAVTLETTVSAFLATAATNITGIRAEVPSAFSAKMDVLRVDGGSTSSIVSGTYVTVNAQVIELRVTIATNTNFSSVQRVEIPIFVRCGSYGERELSFTIIPIADGEDGSVYKLMPDYNIVKGTRSGSSISYSPSTVQCTRKLGKGTSFADSDYGYLCYRVQSSGNPVAYPSGGVPVSSATSFGKIIFYWYTDSSRSVLLDQEVVPIVVDGASGSPGTGIASVVDHYAGPTTDGTNHPADSVFDQQGTTRPTPVGGQYIWTRTTITYTDQNKAADKFYEAQYYPNNGTNGAPGAMLVNRGKYDMNEKGEYDLDGNGNVIHQTYYGTPERRDVVYYNGMWYMALTTAGTFSGIAPDAAGSGSGSGASKWGVFAASLPNLATGLAFIEELVVMRLNTAGEGNNTDSRIVAEGNDLLMFDSTGERMRITGDNLSEFPSSFSGAAPTGVVAFRNGTSWSGGARVTGTSQAVSVTVQAGAVITLPSVLMLCAGGFTGDYEGSSEGYVVCNVWWQIDNKRFSTLHTEDWFGYRTGEYKPHASKQVTLEGETSSLSPGTHEIKLCGEIWLGGCVDAPSYSSWNAEINCMSALNYDVTYSQQKTEIGANGFQVAFGSERLLKCILSGTTTTFLMQSHNAGIEISSSGSGTGTVRIRIGGTWYYAKRTRDNNSGKFFLELSSSQ